MLTNLDRSNVWQTDFVPVAALPRSLDVLAQKFGFTVEEDLDDLGPLTCAYLQTGQGRHFVLCRYRTYPREVVDLFVPSEQEDQKDVLAEIIAELAILPSEVMRTERGHHP
jgi:hypothetical protein